MKYESYKEILEKLNIQNKTISVAESCTGGFLSHLLTKTPGASKVFKGGLVCYNTEIKINVLEIHPEIIAKYSVVSEQVAKAMAKQIKRKFNTHFALATTGNAGPTKDKTHKTVGDVCFGIATESELFSKTIHLDTSREIFIKQASAEILEWFLKIIN